MQILETIRSLHHIINVTHYLKKSSILTMQNIGIFQCSWGLCLRRILWPSSSDGISAQKATSIHKGTDIN
jgi:hypothetical protein